MSRLFNLDDVPQRGLTLGSGRAGLRPEVVAQQASMPEPPQIFNPQEEAGVGFDKMSRAREIIEESERIGNEAAADAKFKRKKARIGGMIVGLLDQRGPNAGQTFRDYMGRVEQAKQASKQAGPAAQKKFFEALKQAGYEEMAHRDAYQFEAGREDKVAAAQREQENRLVLEGIKQGNAQAMMQAKHLNAQELREMDAIIDYEMMLAKSQQDLERLTQLEGTKHRLSQIRADTKFGQDAALQNQRLSADFAIQAGRHGWRPEYDEMGIKIGERFDPQFAAAMEAGTPSQYRGSAGSGGDPLTVLDNVRIRVGGQAKTLGQMMREGVPIPEAYIKQQPPEMQEDLLFFNEQIAQQNQLIGDPEQVGIEENIGPQGGTALGNIFRTSDEYWGQRLKKLGGRRRRIPPNPEVFGGGGA